MVSGLDSRWQQHELVGGLRLLSEIRPNKIALISFGFALELTYIEDPFDFICSTSDAMTKVFH